MSLLTRVWISLILETFQKKVKSLQCGFSDMACWMLVSVGLLHFNLLHHVLAFLPMLSFLMVHLQNPSQSFKSSISESSSKNKPKRKNTALNNTSKRKNSDAQLHNLCPFQLHPPPHHFTPTTAAISKTGVSNRSQSAARYIRTPNARARCLSEEGVLMTNPGKPRTQRGHGLTCSISWDSCLYIYIYIYIYIYYIYILYI